MNHRKFVKHYGKNTFKNAYFLNKYINFMEHCMIHSTDALKLSIIVS